jgi:hypothetical protein
MPDRFDEFIHNENVRNYQRQLLTSGDAGQRMVLLRLLAEEAARAKRAGWMPLYR